VARLEHRHESQDEEDRGEAQPHIDEALDEEVEPAGEVSARHTYDERYERHENHRAEPDERGDLAAEDDARIDVAPVVVGPEEVVELGPERRLERSERVGSPASQGENAPTTMTARRMTAPKAPRGFRRAKSTVPNTMR
jgi:hypothetical protein